jgi:hypothetical protein
MTLADYAVAFEVIAIAVSIEIALRLMPFSWLLEQVGTGQAGPGPSASAVHDLDRLPSFVAAAYRLLPFHETCLRRCLVLCVLLKRRHVPARLCLGVARSGPVLEAHAWIESDVLEQEGSVPRFRELLTPQLRP